MSSALIPLPHSSSSSVTEPLILHIEDEEGGEEERKPKFKIRKLNKVSESGAAILRGIDLEVPKGAIVGVIGPSGSGKSTLLRVLNRLWEPPAGTVYLDGADIRELDVVGLRRKVGMLFQIPPKVFQCTKNKVLRFVPRLAMKTVSSVYDLGVKIAHTGTVPDNIRYGPQLRGKKLTDNEVIKLLTLADLDSSFMKKKNSELSVGQAQRVALARTLANEPEVLLLDEPTSALDPLSTQNIEDVIVKLKKSRGMTIVMVSHSIKQIERIADVVCLLVDGEIIEVLQPDKLAEAKHPLALRFLQLSS